MSDGSHFRRVHHTALRGFVRCIFEASGSLPAEAGLVADHLVDSNLRGHDSHGSIRAAKYVGWVEAGHLLPNRHAEVVSDRAALAVVDGGFGYGQVIGR